MAELIKFGASEVLAHIRHDLREIPSGKFYGNESIDLSLSSGNYSLLEGRCQTAVEANEYRKKIEKNLFQYHRKNLIHAVEIVLQCPGDCPEEQKADFFKESYQYICSTLPMGERCVFVAEVHVDERHFSPAGEMISKDHLHVMYVPAVPDKKHEGFEYRLCADELTKKARLKAFHPGLQKHLDEAGIKATVYRKKESDGKTIPFSISQLKEITEKTGIVFDHSLTTDELSTILNSNRLQKTQIKELQSELNRKDTEIESLSFQLFSNGMKPQTAPKISQEQNVEQIDLKLQNTQLENQVTELKKELEQSRSRERELAEKVEHFERKSRSAESEKTDHIWGKSSDWGTQTRDTTTDVERTW